MVLGYHLRDNRHMKLSTIILDYHLVVIYLDESPQWGGTTPILGIL